jgi:hypothetical protein
VIRDLTSLTELFVSHGLTSREVGTAIELVSHECPWFGDAEEVAEDIGVAMLTDVLPPKVATQLGTSRLIAWHNASARSWQVSDVGMKNASYAALVQTVKQFGVEDGLGSGDFWVVEDSFSGSCATVMMFKPAPVPSDFASALANWMNEQSALLKIEVVNREGDVLFEVVRQADRGTR